MTTIANASALINTLTGGKIPSLDMLLSLRTGGNNGAPETFHFQKPFWSMATAGLMYDAWNVDGMPCAAATPTTWANPTNATAGAIPYTNPGGLRQKFLVSELGSVPTAGSLVIYDRLGHMAGLSGTTAGAQNVNGGSAGTITRNTGGVGNEIWAEIYSAVGTTGTTITASYTNQAGTAGQVTQATTFGGATFGLAPQVIPLALANGDSGVQAVTSAALAASTVSAAGNWGITIARPLVYITMTGFPFTAYFLNGGLAALDANSCLSAAFMSTATNTTTMNLQMFIEMVEA